MWTKYRLRPSDHLAILERQMERCAICRCKLEDGHSTHIDHDGSCQHPGKGSKCCAQCVRGILCRYCNTGLWILEDPERLKRALAYLHLD